MRSEVEESRVRRIARLAESTEPRGMMENLRLWLSRRRQEELPVPAAQECEDDQPSAESPELERAPSAGAVRRAERLRTIIAAVDAPFPLERTPSALADFATERAIRLAESGAVSATGHSTARHTAARNQRLRKQLRVIDAEIAQLRSDVARGSLLRGDSAATERYRCDPDCLVGGCEKEFAAHEGIRCGSCELFLCFECFGQLCVQNECKVGGRFNAEIKGEDGRLSENGSLPCAMFPHACGNGHISLLAIQRAMLHPANRGRDGAEEDVHSLGLSPHKLFLIARRRWAEAEAQAATQNVDIGAPDQAVDLVRTFSERKARRRYATARSDENMYALLTDRLDELDALHAELSQNSPTAAIPAHLRRQCAQCGLELASFEGGECQYFSNRVKRHSHFLCSLCFGEYIMKACCEGGVFEQEIRNDAGVVVSAKGKLPCPFFQHLDSHLAPRKIHRRFEATTASMGLAVPSTVEPEPEPELESEPEPERDQGDAHFLPAMDCRCGNVPMAEIEAVLLDPRNCSSQYWRHRQPHVIIQSHEKSTIELETEPAFDGAQAEELPLNWTVERDEMSGQEFYLNGATGEIFFERPSAAVAVPESESSSREALLLSRGFTPANMHETARLRLAFAEQSIYAAESDDDDVADNPVTTDELELTKLHGRVEKALVRGVAVQCPGCGIPVDKSLNDACIHIDCPCKCKFCFLCGEEVQKCPRGKGAGGCDGSTGGILLEMHPGWGGFAIPDDGLRANPAAYGAMQEFFRQRQAFFLREVKELTSRDVWEAFREKHPDLLKDTPTLGRCIEWDSIDEAAMPLFGGNLARAQTEAAKNPEAARRRLQEHWERVRREEEIEVLLAARRWRHQMICVPMLALFIALLVVGTSVLFSHAPPPNPATALPMLYNESGRAENPAAAPATPAAESENIGNSDNYTSVDFEFDENAFSVQFLLWTPIIELALGLLAVLCTPCFVYTDDIFCEQIALAIAALPFFWHIFVQGTSILNHSWFVAYIWRPVCVFVNTSWMVYAQYSFLSPVMFSGPRNIRTACGELYCFMCCFFFGACLGFAVPVLTIVFTALLRSSDNVENILAVEASEPDTTVFICTWGCHFVAWFPIIVFVSGLSFGAVGVIAWLSSRAFRDVRIDQILITFTVSVISASVWFWPAALDSVVWTDGGGFAAHIAAPLCCCVTGVGWVTAHAHLLVDAVTNGQGYEFAGLLNCLAWVVLVTSLIIFEVGMANLRSANEYYDPPSPPIQVDIEWTGSALWLRWSTLGLMVIGGLEIMGALVAKHYNANNGTQAGRAREYRYRVGVYRLSSTTVNSCVDLVMFALVSFWPVVILDVKDYVSAKWMLVYYVVPVYQGILMPLWVCMASVVLAQEVRVLSDTLTFYAGIAVISASICVLFTAACVLAMVTLRNVGSQAAAEDSVTIKYEYDCTWPCVALRVFLGCALVALAWSMLFPLARFLRGAADEVCLRCMMCFSSVILLGVTAFGFGFGFFGWPVKMPVETLITSSPLWVYVCIPLFSTSSYLLLCKTTENIILGERARLLSRLYDVGCIVCVLSGTGSAWLIYVLRHSTDYRTWPLSHRSKILIWEVLAGCYCGPIFTGYLWNFRRVHADWTQRRSCKLACRTLLLWIPSAAWLLIVLCISGRDHDILNEIFGRFPPALLGLSLSASGFAYELLDVSAHNVLLSTSKGAKICSSMMLGCVVLVVNSWLLLGGGCLERWLESSVSGRLLLDEPCEA